MLLCLDDDDARRRDSAIVEREQSLPQLFRQRSVGGDVETQMDRRRHLVYVLSTRACRPDRREFDFVERNRDAVGYRKVFRHACHTGRTSSGSRGKPPGLDQAFSGE